jgi:hypothetical protein
MSRFVYALLAAVLIASPAQAARLVHPSAAAKSAEKGVSIWRGAAKARIAAPAIKPAAATPCVAKIIVIHADAFAERRLRTQGFWSGDGLTPGMRSTRRAATQGFYADRMAAGL